MGETNVYPQSQKEDRPSAFDIEAESETKDMTEAERATVVGVGNEFVEKLDDGVWMLISGKFTSDNTEPGTEGQVKELLRMVFGYPNPEHPEPDRVINVLLDSPGGSLDSAYATALYLAAYSGDLRVYVPNRAKSASTLLALAAHQLFLSAFGELGPLDTQLHDPRNAANHVSALDCYQSVDYVRTFGRKTMSDVLNALIDTTERRIPAGELLDKASAFALGAIRPMLESVTALDFGGWGRSLMIGERYACRLLEAKEIEPDHEKINALARQLVYGYTHHLFPIDYREAQRIELPVSLMPQKVYDGATAVLKQCDKKNFVGYLSKAESEVERKLREQEKAEREKKIATTRALPDGRHTPQRRPEHAQGAAYPHP